MRSFNLQVCLFHLLKTRRRPKVGRRRLFFVTAVMSKCHVSKLTYSSWTFSRINAIIVRRLNTVNTPSVTYKKPRPLWPSSAHSHSHRLCFSSRGGGGGRVLLADHVLFLAPKCHPAHGYGWTGGRDAPRMLARVITLKLKGQLPYHVRGAAVK
jgi:hypothetical protein